MSPAQKCLLLGISAVPIAGSAEKFERPRVDDVVAYSHRCDLPDKEDALLRTVAVAQAKKLPLETAACSA
jgi:hypothetical protein